MKNAFCHVRLKFRSTPIRNYYTKLPFKHLGELKIEMSKTKFTLNGFFLC